MASFDITLTDPGSAFDVDLLSGRLFKYNGTDWVSATVMWDTTGGDDQAETAVKRWNGSTWVE